MNSLLELTALIVTTILAVVGYTDAIIKVRRATDLSGYSVPMILLSNGTFFLWACVGITRSPFDATVAYPNGIGFLTSAILLTFTVTKKIKARKSQ